jgi:hypothetical protein
VTGAGHHRRSGRGTARRARDAGRLWWDRARTTILGAGALAAAIGAVLALWPSEPAPRASIISVSIVSESMRLHDFDPQLSGSLRLGTTAAEGSAAEGRQGPPVGRGTALATSVALSLARGLRPHPAEAVVLRSTATLQDAGRAECPNRAEGAAAPSGDGGVEECPEPRTDDGTETDGTDGTDGTETDGTETDGTDGTDGTETDGVETDGGGRTRGGRTGGRRPPSRRVRCFPEVSPP